MKFYFLVLYIAGILSLRADPRLTSWMTAKSTQYARVTETTTTSPVAVWPSTGITKNNGSPTQAAPAYADVQQILYSNNFVYVRSADLASHPMGPWYKEYTKTTVNGLWPTTRTLTSKIPRYPTPVTLANQVADQVGQGPVGVLVNGVTIANLGDGQGYDTALAKDAGVTSGGIPGNKSDVWIRNATGAEGPILDGGFGHPAPDGGYHYHANPRALRYQLGDNLTYTITTNPVSRVRTETYTENTTNLHHSPIVGWAYDGYPIYGPYGYSSAMDPNSGVRRMVSGHVPRDGSYGTTNLATAGRNSLAAWAALFHTFTSSLGSSDYMLTSANYGPDVSVSFPIGWYAEDFDFLGDRVKNSATGAHYLQGVDYDLDKPNGRSCVTPEFPGGTYAYFIPVDANGVPAFPYSIGRYWSGKTTGGRVVGGNITEFVTTVYTGGPRTSEVMLAPLVNQDTGNVTLTWNSIEGGTYKVEASNNLTTWTTLAASILGASSNTLTSVVDSEAALPTRYKSRFYRVSRTATAVFSAAYVGQ
jgi:hypothetical protein